MPSMLAMLKDVKHSEHVSHVISPVSGQSHLSAKVPQYPPGPGRSSGRNTMALVAFRELLCCTPHVLPLRAMAFAHTVDCFAIIKLTYLP
jgi:hypothetical protein